MSGSWGRLGWTLLPVPFLLLLDIHKVPTLPLPGREEWKETRSTHDGKMCGLIPGDSIYGAKTSRASGNTKEQNQTKAKKT